MDFQSAMETFAEAWVAANTKGGTLGDVGCTQNQAMALTRGCKTPPSPSAPPPPSLRVSSASTVGTEPPSSIPRSPPPPSSTPKQEPMMATTPNEEYDVTKNSSGRSLPVHCVVEAVAALGGDGKLGWKRRPVVETDSYVIIPANTAFHDLVAVALARLGYPTDSASAARGSVVIKNWKPLNFDKITDGSQATVEDILGELTTVATLRIELYRARPNVLADIKDKLLRLLLLQSHGVLVSTGCPLDEVTLSHLCRSPPSTPGLHHQFPEPSEECRRKFEQWWTIQLAQQASHPPHTPRPPPTPQYSPGSGHHHPSPNKPLERPPSLSENVHPALQTVQSQYPTQKTRMRTSFDPELELPKLQRWFAENQHPSRQQIQQYVKELNGLESRRGRKPLDVNNVVYWFKNARAAQKRAELRGVGPGLSCPLSLNGYNSSSHSPPATLMGPDGLLQHEQKSPSPRGPMFLSSDQQSENSGGGSDQEEDDDHVEPRSVVDPRLDPRGDPRADLRRDHSEMDDGPGSPTAPLSLTTNDKDNNCSNVSPKPQSSPHMDGIKQEPPDEIPSPLPGSNHHNNNNNNNKEYDEPSDVEEEEEDDELEDIEDRRKDEADLGGIRPPERLRPFRTPSPSELIVARGPPHNPAHNIGPGFPLVPNSMFSHSIMYMSHYIPGLAHGMGPATPPSSSGGLNLSALAASADERRKRNRTFIDPVTEVPRLEQWFSLNTHPSHNLILKYTEELNRMPYRQKFPRLEPKNVQFWFKNRRAKCKRLKMSLFENGPSATSVNHQHHHPHPYHHPSPGGRE
ncbi:homeobox protein dve-1 [Anabrus simplex]|uniref:homeobox protein dve-1 n=1 Tax=Anabrus simplex TaxID=316456 RepID=UPI0035A2B84A